MELNAANERLKHRYVAYLRGARQLGEHSIDQIVASLNRFEDYTRRKGFSEFRIEQATNFKKHLATLNTKIGNRRLSKATITSTLYAMRDFIIWLSEQKGFRNRLVRTHADYFKPSRRDEAIARASRPMLVPTVEQIRAMVAAMPATSPVERRNRALVAIIAVTGARDNATASLLLKHLDLDDRQLFQDARDVRTKFGKTFPTWFFPVGDDFATIVAEWKRELEIEHGFGPTDPLFPQTEVAFGAGGEVLPPRLKKECWANADPIRKVFKQACAAAGHPDFKPHSFRHTLAQLGSHVCTTPAEYKAWSQNLGHDGALITLTSYGTLPGYTQRELIAGIGKRASAA
ncbi:tyrosine-type recombinase/integrase [Mesorhizobium sp. PAMC28654]|uniref:tyrosine-type recombinase/integrase n=1 Tax=Mesorhizobium sp. PAMC28654 TaxID=2880934 RepID=UPI001D0B5E02|nr:tyrosine-type recombinase/integrase [Mesorhizobium sp. PAMC28654]UDL87213.1 tyrosine-type recombinase/integrase [Mesorhizobium sp. PAMC28654]